MKNIAKKTAALLLALSMLFSFAACKDKTSGEETTTGEVQADVAGDETAVSGDDTTAVSSEDSTAQVVTETDASGNVVTTQAGGALAAAASVSGKPSSYAEIIAAYTAVVDYAKQQKVGYTKSEWQELPKDKRNMDGFVINAILPVASTFMTSEKDAKGDKKEVKEKGSDMKWFPIYKHSTKGSLMTAADAVHVKSAKCEVLSNGNYRITIVLKDDINPEPYTPGPGDEPNATGTVPKGFVGKMFDPLAKSEIDNTLINDPTVTKVVKNVSYSLKYYDCTAILVYNPKNNHMVSLNQYMHVLIDASGKVIGNQFSGNAVLDNFLEISNIKY